MQPMTKAWAMSIKTRTTTHTRVPTKLACVSWYRVLPEGRTVCVALCRACVSRGAVCTLTRPYPCLCAPLSLLFCVLTISLARPNTTPCTGNVVDGGVHDLPLFNVLLKTFLSTAHTAYTSGKYSFSLYLGIDIGTCVY